MLTVMQIAADSLGDHGAHPDGRLVALLRPSRAGDGRDNRHRCIDHRVNLVSSLAPPTRRMNSKRRFPPPRSVELVAGQKEAPLPGLKEGIAVIKLLIQTDEAPPPPAPSPPPSSSPSGTKPGF